MSKSGQIQVITYNIHKGMGWINHKPTLLRICDYLHERNPDILFLQEIRSAQFDLIATKIWPHFNFGKNVTHKKGNYGNAVFSKFPIQFTQNINLTVAKYENRGMLHTAVVMPDKHKCVHLLCVHLGLLRKDRTKQIKMMLEYIEEQIPAHAPLILGGDFNDWTNSGSRVLLEQLKVQEVFFAKQNQFARTFPAWAPLLRLDRIYVRGFHVERAHRLTQNSWRYLSDHIAIEAILKPQF